MTITGMCPSGAMGCSTRHTGRFSTAHGPNPRLLQRMARQRCATVRTAAAAAAAADVVPYISSTAPKIRSRSISGNPLVWAWSSAASAATRLELLSAVWVDRFSQIGPPLVAGLVGATTGMGVDAVTLLQHGLPPYLKDLLLQCFGVWDYTLLSIVLAAAAVPPAAWALRCWWVANMQLLNSPGGFVQHLLHPRQQQQQQHGQQEEQQKTGLSNWVTLCVVLTRGLCLGTAVSRVIFALASTSPTATAMNAAAAFAAATVAAAPVLLQLVLFSSSGSSGSSGGGSSSTNPLVPAAALMLLAEVSWVVTMLGLSPWLNAAGGVGIAAGLLLLHRQLVAPRLQHYQAAEGDAAEVHVSLRLQGTNGVFDSTLREQPLPVIVLRQPAEHVELWNAACAAAAQWDNDTEEQYAQVPVEADSSVQDTATAPAAAAAAGCVQDERSLFAVQQGIQGWLSNPASRWEVLLPFIADAAAGLYLGQRATVLLYNPSKVGYWNPRFNWWQPTADVMEKFQGETPQVGDAFWYPVADDASVVTRVSSIGQHYVELDANFGVTDEVLELDVQLVRLYKPDGEDEGREAAAGAAAVGAAAE